MVPTRLRFQGLESLHEISTADPAVDPQRAQLLLRINRTSILERISGAVLHRLRNPLQGISMAARSIDADPSDLALVSQLAPVIVDAADTLEQLLDRLGLVASFDMGLTPEPVALQGVVATVQEIFHDLALDNAPSFEVDVTAEVPPVLATYTGLIMVFLNLVINAYDALRNTNAPRVTVSAEHLRPSVMLRVDDNGPGITSEGDHEHSETVVRAGSKNGLGLCAVATYVTAWRGEFELRKSPLGGTRAEIVLPAV